MSDNPQQDKELEHYKHTLARDLEGVKDAYARGLEDKRSRHAAAIESVKGTLAYGRAVLRGGLILNGGAAIAAVSFLSNAIRGGETGHVPALVGPLGLFALGALLPVVSAGLSYLTQHDYSQATFSLMMGDEKAGADSRATAQRWQQAATGTTIVSGVCFVVGVIWMGVAMLSAYGRGGGAEMSFSTMSTLGLALSLVGVLLLFWFGIPFRNRLAPGAIAFVSDNKADAPALRRQRLFDVVQWVGLLLVIAGTGLQIAANYCCR